MSGIGEYDPCFYYPDGFNQKLRYLVLKSTFRAIFAFLEESYYFVYSIPSWMKTNWQVVLTHFKLIKLCFLILSSLLPTLTVITSRFKIDLIAASSV